MVESLGSHRISRRRFLRTTGAFAALAATSSLLAACGDEDDEPVDPAPGADADDEEEPDDTADEEEEDEPVAEDEHAARMGGNLRFAHSAVNTNFDPGIHSSRFANRISQQIYDALINEYESGDYLPGLAESWEVSDDLLQFTLYLREGVTFHDGTPFNAEAVHGTFERIKDPESASLRTLLDDVEEGEVVDEFTYTLHMARATALTINSMSSLGAAPSSMAAVEALGEDFLRNPVGTGPFKISEWRSETELVLERYEDYNWGPPFLDNQGSAYLDTITYYFVPEATTRLVSLESGDVDGIDDPPDIEVERLTDDDAYTVVITRSAGMPQSSLINVTVPPTDELAVRQALLFAIDREAGARLLFHGAQLPAHGPLSSASWAYWDGVEDMYPYDLERAEQLLEEAGWEMGADGIRVKDGQPLRVRHVTTDGPACQIAEFIQGSVRDLGVDYIVECMAYEATVSRMADNDYEVARLGLSSSDPNGAMYGPWHSSQITEGSQFNRSRIADPQLDAWLEEGSSTADLDERREIYVEMQEYIMENAFVIPNWESTLYHVVGSYVQGLKVNITESPYLSDVWLDNQ